MTFLGGGSLPLSGYFALQAQYAATPSETRTQESPSK